MTHPSRTPRDLRFDDLETPLGPELAHLAREIEPERDLWPGIAGRLAARAAAPTLGARLRGRFAALRDLLIPSGAGWSGWAVQAAAALVLLTVGAGFGRWTAPGAAPSAAASGAAVDDVRPVTTQLSALEDDYLRAKDDLWLAALGSGALGGGALEGGRELSPETVAVVENNLRILSAAIREIRQALAADPSNRHLEELLVEQHRKEIRLLQSLTGEPAKV